MMYYDVSQDAADSGGYVPMMHCVKFMSGDTIACGMSWSNEPLRWGKIRPTGIELSPPTTKHTVWAVEPVGAQGNLLLSAWRDGSYR